MAIELEITKPQTVRAATLKIHCKVTDRFGAQLIDDRGGVLHRQEDGYVPSFMPGQHYGDYVILDIDLETGRVLNWKAPKAEDLEKWMSGDEE